MGFRNAKQFGFSITLPFGEHSYTIPSPSVEVGNYLAATTQLAVQRDQLMREALTVGADRAKLDDDDPKAAELDAELERLRGEFDKLDEGLQLPEEMEGEHFEAVLGEAYGKMVANHEPFELVKLASATVMVWVLQSREAAEEYWNSGGRANPPKAPQDRQAKRSKRSTSK